MCFWTPLAYDDWMFMGVWKEINGEKPLSISTLLDFWSNIRLGDNGRLSNTLSPLSTLFSPWKELFPIISGVCVAIIICLSAKLSFANKKVSPFNLSIVWLSILLFLPWRNSLFVADYVLNYIWATTLTLIFMWFTIKFEQKGWSIYNFTFTLILAFFAGGWHEGFAVATICGFLFYTFKCHLRFSPQWYIIGIFYGVVTFIFLYCPGMLDRSQQQLGISNIGQSLLKIIFDFLPVIFIVGLSGFCAIVPPLRHYLKEAWNNKWFVIGTGIIIGGSTLSLLFTHQPRSAFWPDLMALIMIFILTSPFWTKIQKISHKSIIASLIVVLCLIPMIYTLVWQHRLYQESNDILKKLENSPSGTVYHDIIQGYSIPPITLNMTNYPAWVTSFQYISLKEYTGKDYPAVLPLSLKTPDLLSHGKLLKGNMKAVKYDNEIVVPGNPYGKPETISVKVLLKNEEETWAAALLLPFLSEDNKEMSYIVVYGISVDDIEGISL